MKTFFDEDDEEEYSLSIRKYKIIPIKIPPDAIAERTPPVMTFARSASSECISFIARKENTELITVIVNTTKVERKKTRSFDTINIIKTIFEIILIVNSMQGFYGWMLASAILCLIAMITGAVASHDEDNDALKDTNIVTTILLVIAFALFVIGLFFLRNTKKIKVTKSS